MLQLFATFVRIGAFTFGGGYAMLPLIERDIVARKSWLSQDEFIDLFAVAQSLPGVFAVNMSIFIGYKLNKLQGSIVAALGTILPSFITILLLAFFFRQVQENPWVVRIMYGIRPAVIALIASPVISTWKAMKAPLCLLWIPFVVVFLVWYINVSPIWIILFAGIGGIVYNTFFVRNSLTTRCKARNRTLTKTKKTNKKA
jgi:chromate transporter